MLLGRFSRDALVARFGNQRVVRAGGGITTLGLSAGLIIREPREALSGFGAVGLGLSVIALILFRAADHHPDMPRGRSLRWLRWATRFSLWPALVRIHRRSNLTYRRALCRGGARQVYRRLGARYASKRALGKGLTVLCAYRARMLHDSDVIFAGENRFTQVISRVRQQHLS